MEQNLPVVARKFWKIVRVAFFMLKNGISKRKLMMDFNMMMKRGKIAGKAIHNLMFHHVHNHWSFSSSGAAASSNRRSQEARLPFPEPPPGEYYEFSCSNSPALPKYLPFLFNLIKKKQSSHHSYFFPCAHAPPTVEDDQVVLATAVMKALDMYNSNNEEEVWASPALSGFGGTPMVRQLRITDSPFPLRDVEENKHVDEDAEEFIAKFYNTLRQQSLSPAAALESS